MIELGFEFRQSNSKPFSLADSAILHGVLEVLQRVKLNTYTYMPIDWILFFNKVSSQIETRDSVVGLNV